MFSNLVKLEVISHAHLGKLYIKHLEKSLTNATLVENDKLLSVQKVFVCYHKR